MESGPENNGIHAVRHFFQWLVADLRVLTINPAERLRITNRPGRKRVLTPLEQAKVLRSARSRFRALCIGLRETACRPGELSEMSWNSIASVYGSNVTDEMIAKGETFFELIKFKTKGRTKDVHMRRRIPITPRLGRLLVRLKSREAIRSDRIFQNSQGKAWNRNSIRCQLGRVLKRSGVESTRLGEKIVAYTFRHTTATRLAKRGINLKIIGEIMGHTQIKTTAKYVHPDIVAISNLLSGMKHNK
jgi:integrase